MDFRETLRSNLAAVRARIAAACASVRRDPAAVTLIAVTKAVDAAATQALIELGVRDIGENRQQDAAAKFPLVPALAGAAKPKLHFIGPLQRNKVRRVLEVFDVIHSVDSLRLAEEIDKRAAELGREVPSFLEVNVAREARKHGFDPGEVHAALDQLAAKCPRLKVLGLMCMAPLHPDPEKARPHFRRMRELARGGALSMGMSGDFEVAVEEGATHVRVGTALLKGFRSTDGHR